MPLDLVIPPHERRRRIPPLRNGVYILPNLFTTGGLVAGFYSIICMHNGRYRMAASMILLAQLCDALDGRIARLTRSTSSFGVQYDSLADLIAFGVAPGFLVYTWALQPWGRWGWLAATVYVVCAALRLARFTVQVGTVEKRHFVGLPSPAAADVIAATVLIFYYFRAAYATPTKHAIMPIVIFGVAALMVSEVRYFSFKELHIHRRHPFPVLLGVIGLVLLLIGEPEIVLFLGTSGFALSGPIGAVGRWYRRRRGRAVAPVRSVGTPDAPA